MHFPRSPYSQPLIWPSYPSPTSPQLCSAALCVPTIAVAPFPQQPVPEALTCPAAVPVPATSPSVLLPHLPKLVPPLVTPVPTIHVATVPSPTEHPCLPADTPVQVPGMDRTGPKRISADSLCLLHRESYCVDISYFSVCLGSIAAKLSSHSVLSFLGCEIRPIFLENTIKKHGSFAWSSCTSYLDVNFDISSSLILFFVSFFYNSFCFCRLMFQTPHSVSQTLTTELSQLQTPAVER